MGLSGAVIMALERIGTERDEAVSSLTPLISDNDTTVRALAVRALATVGKSQAVVPVLLEVLRKTPASTFNQKRSGHWGKEGHRLKRLWAPC